MARINNRTAIVLVIVTITAMFNIFFVGSIADSDLEPKKFILVSKKLLEKSQKKGKSGLNSISVESAKFDDSLSKLSKSLSQKPAKPKPAKNVVIENKEVNQWLLDPKVNHPPIKQTPKSDTPQVINIADLDSKHEKNEKLNEILVPDKKSAQNSISNSISNQKPLQKHKINKKPKTRNIKCGRCKLQKQRFTFSTKTSKSENPLENCQRFATLQNILDRQYEAKKLMSDWDLAYYLMDETESYLDRPAGIGMFTGRGRGYQMDNDILFSNGNEDFFDNGSEALGIWAFVLAC